MADRSGKVVATVPRSSDEKALRAKVLKYKSTTVERDGATRRENLNCASTGSRTSYRIGTVSLTVGCVTFTPGVIKFRGLTEIGDPGSLKFKNFRDPSVKMGTHCQRYRIASLLEQSESGALVVQYTWPLQRRGKHEP